MKKINFKTVLASCLLTGAMLIPTQGHSIQLLDGLGGAAGYGELAMPRNDDGSSNLLNLPFDINFFGSTQNSFFINNNGNVTFNGRVGSFTPRPFPISNQPMIAPYWADVDTRCAACGEVYVASPNAETTVVTWNNVGFFSANPSATNNFQLILRDQSNVAGNLAGDFDIEFRYDRLEWTTGQASGGDANGLGGTPAQAGFDAGNGTDFFVLPGSFTNSVLDLANTTNVAGAEDGLWSFAIRQGQTPGQTPENPLLPVLVDNTFEFEFGVNLNETIFIDPDVAIGYDYVVTSGPSFTSVELPTGIGDGVYEVVYTDANGNLVTLQLNGGDIHTFSTAINEFRVLGIEESALVDPTDITAFVTGVTFDSTGIVQMTQTPITTFVDTGGNVPEPHILALFGFGLAGIVLVRRKSIKVK